MNNWKRQHEKIMLARKEMSLFFKELRLAGLRVLYINDPWTLQNQCIVDILDPTNPGFIIKLVCDDGAFVVRWSERVKNLHGDARFRTTEEAMEAIRQVVVGFT